MMVFWENNNFMKSRTNNAHALCIVVWRTFPLHTFNFSVFAFCVAKGGQRKQLTVLKTRFYHSIIMPIYCARRTHWERRNNRTCWNFLSNFNLIYAPIQMLAKKSFITSSVLAMNLESGKSLEKLRTTETKRI